MRLLHTFHDDRNARTFSSFLIQDGIENQLEIFKNTDWGSTEYGDITCRIWIIDEDEVDAAHKNLELFLQNPNDEKFKFLKPTGPDFDIPVATAPPPEIETVHSPRMTSKPPPPPKSKPLGVVTFYLIAICTVVFVASIMTRHTPEPFPSSIPPAPLFSSKIEKKLYYDYPAAYDIIDKLKAAYGFEKMINPSLLPPEGKFLLQQFYQTTYWKGSYNKIVASLKNPAKHVPWNEPMFEKVKQGEYWRLLSPVILHADMFHLFFNMIWLLVLGKQMERRLGILRYLLFIVITGIFSNTAQYLMSGSNFIGFSGVLCAMIAYVWVRQKKAPWEGYQLLPATVKFITAFILILAGVQMFSFFLEITGHKGFALPIANTAHLAGALIGFILARMNFFSWKTT